jgi:hypothetical protein
MNRIAPAETAYASPFLALAAKAEVTKESNVV